MHRQTTVDTSVDPTRPLDSPMLEKPEEPVPEGCCQVISAVLCSELEKGGNCNNVRVHGQSGCSLYIWYKYRGNLHEYRVQQPHLKGESPPIKALDSLEELEIKPSGLAEEGKGSKAAEAQ